MKRLLRRFFSALAAGPGEAKLRGLLRSLSRLLGRFRAAAGASAAGRERYRGGLWGWFRALAGRWGYGLASALGGLAGRLRVFQIVQHRHRLGAGGGQTGSLRTGNYIPVGGGLREGLGLRLLGFFGRIVFVWGFSELRSGLRGDLRRGQTLSLGKGSAGAAGGMEARLRYRDVTPMRAESGSGVGALGAMTVRLPAQGVEPVQAVGGAGFGAGGMLTAPHLIPWTDPVQDGSDLYVTSVYFPANPDSGDTMMFF